MSNRHLINRNGTTQYSYSHKGRVYEPTVSRINDDGSLTRLQPGEHGDYVMEFGPRKRKVRLLPKALPEGAAPDTEIPMDIRITSYRKPDPRKERRGYQRVRHKNDKRWRAQQRARKVEA